MARYIDAEMISGFEKIILHLQRKRGESAQIYIDSVTDNLPYKMISCDWNVYHLAITLWGRGSDYRVWLEDTQHIFGREQTIGTKFWDKPFLKSQEEVIEYIQHKMRRKY